MKIRDIATTVASKSTGILIKSLATKLEPFLALTHQAPYSQLADFLLIAITADDVIIINGSILSSRPLSLHATTQLVVSAPRIRQPAFDDSVSVTKCMLI